MNPDDIAALYRSFSPELLGSLRRRFPWSDDIVEDAVQHAFLKLQGGGSSPDEPRAWLRTVAHHYVIDRLRADGRLVRDEEVLIGLHAESPPSTATAVAVSPTLVQRALNNLTTRAQRLLRGKYLDGMTYGALARREGVAKSGMGRILDRARQRLRRAIDELQGPR